MNMSNFRLYALPLVSDFSDSNADHTGRAIRALEENRIADARANVQRICGESLIYALWKHFLGGCIQLLEGDPEGAEITLGQCIASGNLSKGELGSTERTSRHKEDCTEGVHLLQAAAFEKRGFIRRRLERLDEAKSDHQQAYKLRTQCNSPDGCWESALSLGLDAIVARHCDESRSWFLRAAEHAEHSSSPLEFAAVAVGHLVGVLIELHNYEQALSAATRAFELRRAHNPGAIETVLSEALLGRTQLRFAQAQMDKGQSATLALEAGLRSLRRAREELSAFGSELENDITECNDQIDFAERLLQSANS